MYEFIHETAYMVTQENVCHLYGSALAILTAVYTTGRAAHLVCVPN